MPTILEDRQFLKQIYLEGSLEKMIHILAGNGDEANAFAKKHTLKAFKFITGPETLRGTPACHKVVRVGSWRNRKDLEEIEAAIPSNITDMTEREQDMMARSKGRALKV